MVMMMGAKNDQLTHLTQFFLEGSSSFPQDEVHCLQICQCYEHKRIIDNHLSKIEQTMSLFLNNFSDI
jgi:hypothetical protein